MSRARAGAGRSSRSAAALETCSPPATASHTHARRFRTDPSTPRKLNLRKLVRGGGIKRGGLQYIGHESLGTYFVLDALSHGLRPRVEENYPKFVTRHIARAALILLCTVTEIQAHCRFDGANIDARRICKLWEVLLPLSETKELYAGRYSDLMKEKGITGG
jgi:hypothetical protein